MEQELKCPACKRFYANPVMLPCSHNMCLACAIRLQVQTSHLSTVTDDGSQSGGSSHSGTELDLSDLDKLSLISEADSGVVVNSRPGSYIGTPSIGNLSFPHLSGNHFGLTCPVCKKTILLDEHGAKILPKNKSLETIVDKYGESKQIIVHCQLCEGDTTAATKMCLQCKVFYCDKCIESCHPSRGPFAEHELVSPADGKAAIRAENKTNEEKCPEHKEENLCMYCTMCKVTVCYICFQEGRHMNHDVQALGAMCKSQKQDLSQHLHGLSERARSGTEFIQQLKLMQDKVQGNCTDFEARVVAQCDALIASIRARQEQLLTAVREEKARKQRVFRDQVSHCTGRLQRCTGLLQFSIEVLKESDPAAFLQVSNSLTERVSELDKNFKKEMEFEPRVAADFEMNLDCESVQRSINTMNFYQMKAPGPPQVLPAECSAENNTVTIAWRPHPGGNVDGFVLELDDGAGGAFREVYCGKESICTVEGLHFDSVYKARVRAFNHAGDSPYSDCIALQTAEIAWFGLDQGTCHDEITISNDNMSATCRSCDDRVMLGSVGFSKGVHYWEVTIDRLSADCDPSFGIARFDVPKDQRIGKDNKGYAMYIDKKRSWFLHSGQHTDRTDGGIRQGSVVGVLLDLNHHTLSFFLDGHAHGPIAFTGLKGVFYPAFSFNHNVQITLHTGLEVPPVDTSSSDEDLHT